MTIDDHQSALIKVARLVFCEKYDDTTKYGSQEND